LYEWAKDTGQAEAQVIRVRGQKWVRTVRDAKVGIQSSDDVSDCTMLCGPTTPGLGWR